MVHRFDTNGRGYRRRNTYESKEIFEVESSVQHDEKYAEDDLRQHKIKSALTAALNQARE